MTRIFGAVAAIILALMLFAPPAEARCWWNGYRWHCTHYRHRYYSRYWYSYPYYGYYPYYYRPYVYACVWPYCW